MLRERERVFGNGSQLKTMRMSLKNKISFSVITNLKVAINLNVTMK